MRRLYDSIGLKKKKKLSNLEDVDDKECGLNIDR